MEIPLTRGLTCRVDQQTFAEIGHYKWCASKTDTGFYAVRGIWNPTTKKTVLVAMHRVILKAVFGQVVDHINGDTLDNRLENLRFCTQTENIRKMHKDSKGVYYMKRRAHLPKPWQAYIGSKMGIVRRKHLGYFSSKEEAQDAYNKEARLVYGDFFQPPTKKVTHAIE